MAGAPWTALAARARTTASWLRARPATAAALYLAAAVLVILLDLVLEARRWPIAVTALLDEPAHLLTAALLLAAALPRRARAVVPWALLGSVLIDLDHIPLYVWGVLTADGYGRPVTHSAATVLALAIAGTAARSRARTALWGLALGVGLHLVRDLCTGPGVPLWWPVGAPPVLLPYSSYVAVLLITVVVAVVRLVRQRALGDLMPTAPSRRPSRPGRGTPRPRTGFFRAAAPRSADRDG